MGFMCEEKQRQHAIVGEVAFRLLVLVEVSCRIDIFRTEIAMIDIREGIVCKINIKVRLPLSLFGSPVLFYQIPFDLSKLVLGW